jgi:hypothetical protein
MQNTSPSTEDSYISTAGNYGFVFSLYFCKDLLYHGINSSWQDSKRKAKNPIKAHGGNHHTEDKREGQKMRRQQEPKKGDTS